MRRKVLYSHIHRLTRLCPMRVILWQRVTECHPQNVTNALPRSHRLRFGAQLLRPITSACGRFWPRSLRAAVGRQSLVSVRRRCGRLRPPSTCAPNTSTFFRALPFGKRHPCNDCSEAAATLDNARVARSGIRPPRYSRLWRSRPSAPTKQSQDRSCWQPSNAAADPRFAPADAQDSQVQSEPAWTSGRLRWDVRLLQLL